jgi:hypothetical protein
MSVTSETDEMGELVEDIIETRREWMHSQTYLFGASEECLRVASYAVVFGAPLAPARGLEWEVGEHLDRRVGRRKLQASPEMMDAFVRSADAPPDPFHGVVSFAAEVLMRQPCVRMAAVVRSHGLWMLGRAWDGDKWVLFRYPLPGEPLVAARSDRFHEEDLQIFFGSCVRYGFDVLLEHARRRTEGAGVVFREGAVEAVRATRAELDADAGLLSRFCDALADRIVEAAMKAKMVEREVAE